MVGYVASLARLEVSDDEINLYAKQLSDILKYVEKLKELDTSDVPPTAHAVPITNALRDDVPHAPFDPALALSNAPEQQDNMFRVPKVLDQEAGNSTGSPPTAPPTAGGPSASHSRPSGSDPRPGAGPLPPSTAESLGRTAGLHTDLFASSRGVVRTPSSVVLTGRPGPCSASPTAFELTSAIRSGAQSAEQVVRECLERIGRIDVHLQAFISTFPERSLSRAREIDDAVRRGEYAAPLAGLPIAVKDNICTSFGTTTCAAKILESFRSKYAAHVVDRLESAGAVIVGKTNLDAFAMGSSTENSSFFTTRNPWDESRVAGGSSGGSAAAVAAGLVPAALGSDTGGSVRLPASFCGVVGMKPTYGLVSRYGLVAFGSSLDQIGTLTADARDAALILSVIAGHDERDSTSVDAAVPDYLAGLDRTIKGLRIGISDEYFGDGLDHEVRASVEAAIDALKESGATTVSLHLPHMKYATACYYIIATAEASSNLARFDGVHYGYRTARPRDIFDLYSSSRGEGLGAEVKRRIMLGTFVLSSGYYDAYYLKALKVRTLIKRDFDLAFERADVIAAPVAPTPAFAIGEKCDDPLAMYLSDIYTISANLAGVCAITVPCGLSKRGLPIGFQLMGPAFGEEKLLSAAHQYQLVTDHHKARPPCSAAAE